MGMRGTRCGLDLGGAGMRTAVADVFLDAAEEQRGVLRHQGKAAAQVGRVQFDDRLSVQQQPSLLRIEETQEQIEQGRLAGTGRSDQGQGFPGSTARLMSSMAQCSGRVG